MLPTLRHCHRCQDVSGGQGLPSWGEGTHPAHADQTREPRGVRARAGGDGVRFLGTARTRRPPSEVSRGFH